MDQRAKAKRFLELHTSGRLLVLPNAWDAGSARIFEHAGFQALGTTSAGVALSLGYPFVYLAGGLPCPVGREGDEGFEPRLYPLQTLQDGFGKLQRGDLPPLQHSM